MIWDPSTPYNDLPLLPPAGDLETKEILKLCIKARVALEHLNMVVETSAYKDAILGTIPLLESHYSCAIENINTAVKELFIYHDRCLEADPTSIQALRNENALRRGYRDLGALPLNKRMAGELCSIVNGYKVDFRKETGTSLAQAGTMSPFYTPPEGQEVIFEKMLNWEVFLNNEELLDPLVVMALCHYQFEAIHPFVDGNGRTGRIVNQLYLIQKKVLRGPFLCLSRFISMNRYDYYTRLLNVTKQSDWNNWLKFMLIGIEKSAIWTAHKCRQIIDLLTSLERTMDADTQLHKIKTKCLMKLLGTYPVIRIGNIVDADLARRKTASKYLNLLCSKGILDKSYTNRGHVFINKPYLKLLEED